MDFRFKPDLEYISVALYVSGWRAEDREQLISDFNLTGEYADSICDMLRRCEEMEARNGT